MAQTISNFFQQFDLLWRMKFTEEGKLKSSKNMQKLQLKVQKQTLRSGKNKNKKNQGIEIQQEEENLQTIQVETSANLFAKKQVTLKNPIKPKYPIKKVISRFMRYKKIRQVKYLIFKTIEELLETAEYNIDTYFICLKILDKIKISLNWTKMEISFYGAVITMIASKLCQDNFANIRHVVEWIKTQFPQQFNRRYKKHQSEIQGLTKSKINSENANKECLSYVRQLQSKILFMIDFCPPISNYDNIHLQIFKLHIKYKYGRNRLQSL